MRRSNHARAPEGADGTCRNQRRPRGTRWPAWVRPLLSANRGLNACVRLIESTLLEVATSECDVLRRPVGTWLKLYHAMDRLRAASNFLGRAMRDLGRTADRIARHPESAGGAPALIVSTTESWVEVAKRLTQTTCELYAFQNEVFHGLETGTLIPERHSQRRMQFALALRPAPFRAFLLRRQPRVVDRIASILRRRWRTLRPAALPVPLVAHQGRAPPLSSLCPL